MLTLALRNIFRHRFRTWMTIAAIVAGVVGLALAGGFIRDLYYELGEALIHSQSGHIQVSRLGFRDAGSRSPEKFQIEQPDALRQKLVSVAGVDDVMARLAFSGLLNNGRTDLSIIGEGIEPEREARMGSRLKIIAGDNLDPKTPFGMLIGTGVAKALKLAPGDRVTLLANTLDGALNTVEFEIVGVFQTFSKEFDARAVRVPLASAQDLLGRAGANVLVLSLKRTEDTDTVSAALQTLLDAKQFEFHDWRKLNEFYESTVALYDRQFGVLQLIILILVLLSVTNSVNMNALERVGEFGTMMALGNRRGQVFRLLVAENILTGLIGAALGVVVAFILAYAISAIGIPMPPPPNSDVGYTAHIRLSPAILAGAFTVGFMGTWLAALLPARRVTRVEIVDALRQNT